MQNNKEEILSLTGLRGIAALSVMFAHFLHFNMPLPGDKINKVLPRFFTEMFNISDYGMTIFFVLSGFVITYNYSSIPWKEQPLRSLARFFLYRFARLYPLLLLFIVLVIWQKPDFSSSLHDPKFTRDIITALAAIQSWFPYLDMNGSMVIEGNFFFSWSISTEFFLYLTFALMMIFTSKFNSQRTIPFILLAYALIAIGLLLFWNHYRSISLFPLMPEEKYHRWLFEASPYSRMLEFCLGMSACHAFLYLNNKETSTSRSQLILSYSSIACLFICFAIWLGNLIGVISPRHFQTRLIIAVAIFLLLISCNTSSFVNRILSSKPLVFIGTISYSLYLFHYLPPRFISNRMLTEPLNVDQAPHVLAIFIINFILSTIFAFAIAYGLYRLVEVPSRRFIRAHIPQIMYKSPVSKYAV